MRCHHGKVLSTIVGALLIASPALAATVEVNVPGTANPYLAGMPSGTACCAASPGPPDSVPSQSPVQVSGLTLTAGTVLTFTVTGSVSFMGGTPTDPPDGGVFNTLNNFGLDGTPSSDGIAGMLAPQDALVGLFLDDSLPTSSAAPPRLDFSGAGLGTNFAALCPGLKQPFFIGDGRTAMGTVQQFVVPWGTTRFFLGVVDGLQWNNNTGSFSVQVTSSSPVPAGSLAAAVLPTSRSVQVGSPATAFATILNPGSTVAVNCGITPATSVPAGFVFQATNPSTNAITSTANTPACVVPGGSQTYMLAFTPSAAFGPTDVGLTFQCSNSAAAPVVSGLDTLLLSASAGPVPDIVALVATANNDGIVDIPGAGGTGVFAVATANVGAGGQITVSADTAAASLPVSLSLCQTDPTTGACLAAPSSSVTVTINSGAMPTFGVFVQGQGPVSFDPAKSRVFVRFLDASNIIRGATSAAPRTQ
jgi:hypothetical protein